MLNAATCLCHLGQLLIMVVVQDLAHFSEIVFTWSGVGPKHLSMCTCACIRIGTCKGVYEPAVVYIC